jgi:hypothetical protein
MLATGDVLAPQRSYILDTAALPADVRTAAGLMAGDSEAADHLTLVGDFAPKRDAAIVIR